MFFWYSRQIRNIEVVETITGNNEIQLTTVQIPSDHPDERGVYSTATVNVDFSETKEGIDNNVINLDDINFTTR